MGMLKSKSGMCPVDQHCAAWASKYMGYCLCSTRDGFSLALGMISVMSWGVAEIPQIITNYKNKSSEGLSIVFLSTWIIGDCFNLFGCILEPATLPTQYYMAVLYTVTTLILSAQALYYGHVYPRLKSNKRRQEAMQTEPGDWRREHDHGVDAEKGTNTGGVSPTSPIPFPSCSPSTTEDLFFMSARSLSVSHTPPVGSFPPRRTPPTSDVEHLFSRKPLLGDVRVTQSAPPAKMKTMFCVFSLTVFFIGTCNRQFLETHENNMSFRSPTKGIVLPVGRGLLEANATRGSTEGTLASEKSGIGSFLGWGMSAIYLGGRLPQICLNMKRGNAEGLNPLMFLFAVVGNTTYVASILVSSLEWSKIKPNLPWLVDSGGCVILDIFILTQFMNFRHRSRSEVDKYVS